MGDTIWTRIYGDTLKTSAYDMQQTHDSGYIIVGSIYQDSINSNNADCWIIRIDANGDTLWTTYYGGSEIETPYSVQQTKLGNFIICGETYTNIRDAFVIKIDPDGDTLWTAVIGGDMLDCAGKAIQTLDNGYMVFGTTYSFGSGGSDVWLIRFESDEVSIYPYKKVVQSNSLVTHEIIHSKLKISYTLIKPSFVNLAVYNPAGRLLKTLINEKQGAHTYSTILETKKMSAGQYYYRFKTDENVTAVPFIVIK